MSIPCPDCAAQMPDAAAYCPGCGRAMGQVEKEQVEMVPVERARGTVGALPESVAGALAYFTIIPAVMFLLVEPYSKNRFVRFHAYQSIAVSLVALVVGASLRVVGFVVFFIPRLGPLVVWLASGIIMLAFFAVWVVLVVKALQGQMYKLPVIGEFADGQASAD